MNELEANGDVPTGAATGGAKRPRITLYEAALIYALGAVAMIPWGALNAAADGLAGSFSRTGIYSLVGAILPATLGVGLAAWRRSFSLGAVMVVIVALMAWRGA
ncbi:hypothetical protein OVY29_13030 [Sphingopyxis sp. SE2]|uniref:hypothetical protein n=1 Tax=Sphingopyxis sp. SE2 TaxID=1586240 RepID=UPI0028C2A811|nr:hypothetical protein [Sphingopyxis sp. SE2]MDT7529584.1 hypothetical protein [Sphingopyxis sp. SE2]